MGIYIQYILYSLVLIFYLKYGGGLGGGVIVFLAFYAISNISRNKNSDNIKNVEEQFFFI